MASMRPNERTSHQVMALEFNVAPKRSGDCVRKLAAGDRVAGKAEGRERRQRVANRGKPHHGRGEVRHVGPFMHEIERTRIGDAALRKVLGDHEVEPGAAPGAEKIAGAQDDGAHAALGGFPHALLDDDAQLSLARGRPHRRRLVEHRRHAGAVIVDVAGKQQGRARRFGRLDRDIGERERMLRPLG